MDRAVPMPLANRACSLDGLMSFCRRLKIEHGRLGGHNLPFAVLEEPGREKELRSATRIRSDDLRARQLVAFAKFVEAASALRDLVPTDAVEAPPKDIDVVASPPADALALVPVKPSAAGPRPVQQQKAKEKLKGMRVASVKSLIDVPLIERVTTKLKKTTEELASPLWDMLRAAQQILSTFLTVLVLMGIPFCALILALNPGLVIVAFFKLLVGIARLVGFVANSWLAAFQQQMQSILAEAWAAVEAEVAAAWVTATAAPSNPPPQQPTALGVALLAVLGSVMGWVPRVRF